MAQHRRPGGGRLAGFFSGMAGAGADLLQESRVRQQQKLDQAERLLQQLQLAAIENPEALQALKSMAGDRQFPESLERAVGAMAKTRQEQAAKDEAERVEIRDYERSKDAQEQRHKQNVLGVEEMKIAPPRPQAKVVTSQGQIIDPEAPGAPAVNVPNFKAAPGPVGREPFDEWKQKEDYRQQAGAKKLAAAAVANIAKSQGVQAAAVARMELSLIEKLFDTSEITAEDYANRVQAVINKFVKPAVKPAAGAAPFNPPRVTRVK